MYSEEIIPSECDKLSSAIQLRHIYFHLVTRIYITMGVNMKNFWMSK